MSKYTKNDAGDFVCQSCGIVHKNQNTMHYHMKRHEDKLDFECNICFKEFIQKRSLELHMLARHAPENAVDSKESVDKYKCVVEGCSFRSLTKGNRRSHCMRKHFKEETDALLEEHNGCRVCKKEFPSSSAFYYHSINCIKTDNTEKLSIMNLVR
jgi:hypothetical protein